MVEFLEVPSHYHAGVRAVCGDGAEFPERSRTRPHAVANGAGGVKRTQLDAFDTESAHRPRRMAAP